MASVDQIVDRVSALCPEAGAETVRAILGRAEEGYVENFSAEEIARHVKAITALSAERTAVVLIEREKGGSEPIRCTIVAFDHPFEFSSITGVMAGTGFNIESSDAFT